MSSQVLITCGTSILDNAGRAIKGIIKITDKSLHKRLGEVGKRYGLVEWSRAEPDSKEDIEAGKHAFHGSSVFKVLVELLNSNPETFSAEVNTFRKFRELRWDVGKDLRIFLYSSDTGLGKLCSEVIKYYLINFEGIKNIQRVAVKGFSSSGVKTLDQFKDGIFDLMDKVVRVVVKGKSEGRRSYILATAGFKPETTSAVIAALLSGADGVYYVYESSRDLVELPALPIGLNREVIEELKTIFGKRRTIPLAAIESQNLKERIDNYIERGLLEYSGKLNENVRVRNWVKYLMR